MKGKYLKGIFLLFFLGVPMSILMTQFLARKSEAPLQDSDFASPASIEKNNNPFLISFQLPSQVHMDDEIILTYTVKHTGTSDLYYTSVAPGLPSCNMVIVSSTNSPLRYTGVGFSTFGAGVGSGIMMSGGLSSMGPNDELTGTIDLKRYFVFEPGEYQLLMELDDFSGPTYYANFEVVE